ncbi:MAG: hypothetical protein ACLKAN_13065 [Alkaliphilus sp.]
MENVVEVENRIKIFISSCCGAEKYNLVRKKLKKLLEETGFVKVYLFEDGLASTQTVSQVYLYALDDSDVCIFLIDNADGVTSAVLREINRAKAHPKKSLYVFCKEGQEEPTQIQNELEGAQGVRYSTVETFEEFVSEGYASLINDISDVYSNYCKSRLIDDEFQQNQGTKIEVDSIAFESLEKRLLKGIDKTKFYLSSQIFNESHREAKETNDLDLHSEAFLHVIFGERNIREFNIFLLLEVLKGLQSAKLHEVVVNRWKAIQYFWNDNLEKCIDYLNKALVVAKENDVPNWFIQDILIDLRNATMGQRDENNQIIFPCDVQKKLNCESIALFYPLVDRYDKSLYEKITKEAIKSATQSPYAFSWDNNITTYIDYLSNSYVVSVFNGSLTHTLMIKDMLKDIAFSLCKRYSDWQFRVLLLKLSISNGNKKEIKGFIDLFNDIFGKMNASDSLEIYRFCDAIPIKYRRNIAKLEAFKHLGSFFSDSDYEDISCEIVDLINDWIAEDRRIVAMGASIFDALKKNYDRIGKNIVMGICLGLFEKSYIVSMMMHLI